MTDMGKIFNSIIATAVALALPLAAEAQIRKNPGPDKQAVMDLIERVVPGASAHFEVRFIPDEGGKDVFEVASDGRKIILSGNNGVSVASAYNWYLKNCCNFELTWNGPGCGYPETFPKDIRSPVRSM